MKFKFIASSAAFFGLGALFAWAITQDRADLIIKDLQEEIDVRKTMVRNKNAQIKELSESLEEYRDDEAVILQREFRKRQEAEAAEPAEVTFVKDREESPNGETPEETRANLQGLIDQYTGNPDDHDVFVERAGKAIEMDRTPPFVITREQYAWDSEEGDEYEKITITYYPKNRVLLDDDQDPIEDVDSTVGWKNLNQFGGDSGDPDVVFIRNRRMLSDFEVVRMDDSELPTHVKYGMPRTEFETQKAAGLIKFREGDV